MRSSLFLLAPLAVAPLSLVMAAPAEMPAIGHHAMAMPAATDAPSTAALKQANATMHQGMDIAYTGNADVDFTRGMIAHHQGAIDMANAVLKYGQDPEIRKLATGIVAAQTQEIAQMKAWLAKHPVPAKK